MKTFSAFLLLVWSAVFAADAPAPPPSAPPKRSAAELEKLVGPIALYPDPLIATILPASVYPLEIVQAARFVSNTNNLAKLDEQPWDPNVKAVARVPDAIKKLNDELPWTMELGDAFLAQDKDVMDAIQSMRAKAQGAGTLKTTPQQIVTVTNMIVEKTIEQQVVVVTNTIVQVQPSNPQVVYVPTYNPAVVYAPPPGPPPGLTFAAGVAVGAIIANNCDWHHGGCYSGDVDVNVNRNVNVNQNVNQNVNRSANASAASAGAQKKWQPDQSRLSKSGTPSSQTSAGSKQARGYGAGGASPQASAANRGSPSTAGAGARPSAGTSTASRQGGSPGASSSQAVGAQARASSPQASASSGRSGSPQASASPSAGRSSSESAFGGAGSGSSGRSESSRGASSRGGGSGGRGGGGGRR